MLALMIILLIAFGALCGYVISLAYDHRESLGYLRVDNSDPDGPYLFLELNKPVQAVTRCKYATFIVKCEDFIPRD